MMAKENTPGQKPASGTPKAANVTNSIQQRIQATPQPRSSSTAKKGGTKGNKSRIGGTAVPGAKSTAPKPPPTTNNSSQQQAESYNRDMRRRMQHLGTGPYNENQKATTAQEQRRKRIERKKQRLAERQEHFRKTTPTGKITLGRRNLYFILGVVALIILIIVVFVILRATHVLH
jgi:cobalamin biosynthesis Mg chelatase CobN